MLARSKGKKPIPDSFSCDRDKWLEQVLGLSMLYVANPNDHASKWKFTRPMAESFAVAVLKAKANQ